MSPTLPKKNGLDNNIRRDGVKKEGRAG